MHPGVYGGMRLKGRGAETRVRVKETFARGKTRAGRRRGGGTRRKIARPEGELSRCIRGGTKTVRRRIGIAERTPGRERKGETLTELVILFEDRDLLVAVKPEGVDSEASHGLEPDMVNLVRNHIAAARGETLGAAAGVSDRTLQNALGKHAGAGGKKRNLPAGRSGNRGGTGEPGTGVPYVGLIQRLDKPVRGIMVFAKNPETAAALSRDLREKKIHKKYRAILCGQPREKSGTLTDWIAQNPGENTAAVVKKDSRGAKEAVLNYTLLRKKFMEGEQISEVEIELLTGRHHQIRVQFASRGLPLMGDRKYNSAYQENPPKGLCGSTEMGQHLCLTASELVFTHPRTRKQMRFTIEPAYTLL